MEKLYFFFVFILNGGISIAQNIGIGTAVPVFKLDVQNGSINTDSVYRIGSTTVLGAAGLGNLFIGKDVGLMNTGFYNTFSGSEAGNVNTTGNHNSFFGREAGRSNTTGNYNTFSGVHSGFTNTTGNDNSFYGKASGYFNTQGSFNAFNGVQSGYKNTTGLNNSFFGGNSGYSNTTGIENSFFGFEAGKFTTTASFNTFCGSKSGFSNTTGFDNTFVGVYSGNAINTGSMNSFFGANAGLNSTIGNDNCFFGRYAGFSNTTGSRNTIIGSAANVSAVGLTNASAIGYGAIVNAGNKIRLGSTAVTVIEGQVAYSFPSDGRFKTNVTETVKGLDFIMKLRPVVYNFESRRMDEFITGKSSDPGSSGLNYLESERMRQSGFIAQEVEEAARVTGYDFNGVLTPKNEKDIYSLAYSQFVVPLVKAMQEQQKLILDLKKEIEELKKKLN